MVFNIIALISVLVIIILMRRMVTIFPSLIACTLRWKESVNLEASVKHSLDRNMLAAAMALPFCLVVERFRLYELKVIEELNNDLHLAVIIGVFAAYFLIRLLLSRIMRPRRIVPKTYKTAEKASLTFFIILTIILMAMGSVMSFIGIDESITRTAMLCVSASIYMLFLIRKTQIFTSGCSFFTAFLYLCALEILPTGVLVASAIIF